MQLRTTDIYVYKVDDEGNFYALGEITKYTSLIWPDKFNGYATFELNAPITPENKSLIKKGNIIWCGGDNACVIEIIQSDKNDEGLKTYKVKGRTLEMLLTTRIIWGTYFCQNKNASTAMYEIVDKQCVNPTDFFRKIPFLECAEDEQLGKIISFQKTGGEVYDSLVNIASDADLGFDVLFRPREKKLVFKVTEGVDRTAIIEARNGSQLYCVITDAYGNKVQTETVTISMIEDNNLKILTQPANASAAAGENVTVQVKVQGEGLTYQWYFIDKGSSEVKTSSTKTATYSVGMNSTRDGRQLYCVIKDAYGNKVTTKTVTISMIEANTLKILAHPADTSVAKGETVKVSVVAQGEGLTYQWYFKDARSNSFKASSIKTSTYSTVMTAAENAPSFVIFSTDLEDILSSSYYTNDQDIKTLAYVAGEGQGSERKYIISGNSATKGFGRRELYVDARDLQSTITNEDGSTTTINHDEYNDMLNSRGEEKLSVSSITETFDAKMRVTGDIQYIYGVDYFKGDMVIVQDTDIGVQVKAKVTEVSENFDDEYELVITFGYSYPTIIEKVKRQIS